MSFKFNETMLKVESDKVENSLNTKMQEKECFIEGDKISRQT